MRAVVFAALLVGAALASTPDVAVAQTVRSSFDVILFDVDSADVPPAASQSIQEAADWIATHSDARLVVEGHTDRHGPRAYNQWLSRRRAEAVRDELVAIGVPLRKIAIVASGEREPISEAAPLNRRVRIWATTF